MNDDVVSEILMVLGFGRHRETAHEDMDLKVLHQSDWLSWDLAKAKISKVIAESGTCVCGHYKFNHRDFCYPEHGLCNCSKFRRQKEATWICPKCHADCRGELEQAANASKEMEE